MWVWVSVCAESAVGGWVGQVALPRKERQRHTDRHTTRSLARSCLLQWRTLRRQRAQAERRMRQAGRFHDVRGRCEGFGILRRHGVASRLDIRLLDRGDRGARRGSLRRLASRSGTSGHAKEARERGGSHWREGAARCALDMFRLAMERRARSDAAPRAGTVAGRRRIRRGAVGMLAGWMAVGRYASRLRRAECTVRGRSRLTSLVAGIGRWKRWVLGSIRHPLPPPPGTILTASCCA